jgi:hypothetical protein
MGRPPSVVVGLIEMLASVEFHDQSRRRAVEVDNEWADRRLPAPLPIAEPSSTQFAPKPAFGVRLNHRSSEQIGNK